MKKDISVIVPFYERDDYAVNIYREINKQSKNENLEVELIFVDSNSRTTLEKKIAEIPSDKNLECKIYDTRDYVSVKRNFGISKAVSSNIIIIDDDCIPCNDFLVNHYDSLSNSGSEKVLFSGIVKYHDSLIRKSNYFKFRDQGHRIFDKKYNTTGDINFHNIVVMNMSFKKEILLENSIKFNEEFNTYGFEDLQFGIDAISKNFSIKTNNAKIIHQDSTPIDLYRKKLQSFGKTYFFLFYPYNKNKIKRSKNGPDSEVRSHFLEYKVISSLAAYHDNYRWIYNLTKPIFIFFGKLLNLSSIILVKLLIITDNFPKFYFFFLYKLFVRITILSSYFDKKEINKEWL